jgi:hypothetical protein
MNIIQKTREYRDTRLTSILIKVFNLDLFVLNVEYRSVNVNKVMKNYNGHELKSSGGILSLLVRCTYSICIDFLFDKNLSAAFLVDEIVITSTSNIHLTELC